MTCPTCSLLPSRPDLWFDDVDPDDVEATVGAEAANIMRRRMGTLKANPLFFFSLLLSSLPFPFFLLFSPFPPPSSPPPMSP